MPNNNTPQYYMGDKNLPLPDVEFEYTPKMIKEIKRCKDKILHFAENYFFITNVDRGKEKIQLYKPQKRVIKKLSKNRFAVVLSSRQAGKTTMMTIYALWNTCFQSDKNVLIVANKEDTAKMILARIKMAYEQLPNWLKPGVKEWAKTGVTFANDSGINISTTTASAGRGQSINVLIIDEMGFVPEHIMKEFWTSVIPVISSSQTAKIFVVSTPNGTGNLFHKLYTEAERGELDAWIHDRIDWWEIPGRGKKWKRDQEQTLLGEGKSFDQEYGNIFIELGQSAIDAELLQHFRNISRDGAMILEDGHYKIWEPPDPERLYAVGVDVGEGIGQAASVAQIIDITDCTDIRQVGCYHNNAIDPFHFAEVLMKITNQWGRPFLLIERNNCGGQVIDALVQVHHYRNIVDYTPKKQKYYNKLGVYSHTNSKYKGVMNMRYWVNSLRVVKIYDIALVQELETFVKWPNGTWKKKSGDYIYDDRVLSLVWALFALEPEITQRYYEIVAYDQRGKPLKIVPIQLEDPKYFKVDGMYRDDPNAPIPTHIGVRFDDGDDEGLESLLNQGWRTL